MRLFKAVVALLCLVAGALFGVLNRMPVRIELGFATIDDLALGPTLLLTLLAGALLAGLVLTVGVIWPLRLRLHQRGIAPVETQFALGHLFRRRGEVDRAIRLHQSLVGRPGLSDEQKTRAVLALGEDYMRAGLLDRAETLFTDLVRVGVLAPQALEHLISIYQSRSAW